jgi:hypothetical protein
VAVDPIRELELGHTTCREGDELRDNLGIGTLELETIEAQEGHHGQEPNSLVAVVIGVIPDEPECICGGERRQTDVGVVVPLLLFVADSPRG